MPVYVDNSATPYRGMKMSHLLADTPEELHAMATRLGLRREWFQDRDGGTPHYDLCQSKRKLAIALGAIEVDRRQTVTIVRRLRKQRIEAMCQAGIMASTGVMVAALVKTLGKAEARRAVCVSPPALPAFLLEPPAPDAADLHALASSVDRRRSKRLAKSPVIHQF